MLDRALLPGRGTSLPESMHHAEPSGYAFGRHAGDWWDPDGPLRTLHAINPVRLDYIDRCCSLSGKRVLDLGCGGGLLCEAMAGRGADVTGVDTAAELIETATAHADSKQLAIDYVIGSSSDLLERGAAPFDVVACLEMLEHVADPAAVIDDCARLLRPGGDLVLSTLNRTPAAWALAIVGAEYITGLLPRGTHDYDQFIRPSELSACCRSAGLEVRDISGLAYIPWLNRAFISHSTAVNYLLHARRPE